jgi:sugar lactone lactonase YvrE
MERKLVLFGVGQIAEKEIKSGLNPLFLVDNNKDLHGTKFLGFEVHDPSKINESEVTVLICSSSISEILQQLQKINVDSSTVQVSSHLKVQERLMQLEKFKFRGYISSGLPSHQNSLEGGGIFFVEELGSNYTISKIFEANTHGMVFHEDHLIVSAQNFGILELDRQGNIKKQIELPAGLRPHGIQIYQNHYFVACSTGDCVLELNSEGEILNRFSISEKINRAGTPQHHCNDLLITQDSIFLSMFSISGNWKKGVFDGGILEFDRKTGKQRVVCNNLKMPHSLCLHEENMYVLDSYRGAILGYDFTLIGKLNGFVRGLTFASNFLIVAESKNRNVSKLERSDLISSIDTRISIISPDIKAARSIQLPKTISEVHAILYDPA